MSETKTALVMIHGLLGSIDYFEPARLLADRAVYTPHLLGYGSHTETPGAGLTLRRQAEIVVDYIAREIRRPVWVLGHSVGGAIAMLAAELAPKTIVGVVSVEGNFTLNDAFWCRKIAPMNESAWHAEYAGMQADPAAWLALSEVEASPERLQWAQSILQHQSAATVQAMARAVVTETGAPAYLETIRELIKSHLPIHLLAGERSAQGWDIPSWLREDARSYLVLQNTGHMMMLENPVAFCKAVDAMTT